MSFDDIKTLALPAALAATGLYLLGTAFSTTQDLHHSQDAKRRWLPDYSKWVEGAAAGGVGIIGVGAIIYASKIATQN
jgi:NhaP-type Na+/H+ or K+/H+ antiporter